MKNLFILLLLLMPFNSIAQKLGNVECIYISTKTFSDTKYIPPLIISKEKLYMQTDDKGEDSFFTKKQRTPSSKEEFIGDRYRMIITDNETYSSILDFIKSNQKYYIDIDELSDQEKNGSLLIKTDRKTYVVYYKRAHDFLGEMATYLSLKNCDKDLLNLIKRYR